ncbi:Ribose-phosphate pyrophosphokinase [Minicystis rosea]|nr:Ribose-phosphate pyrophosphokinase [Minicystis rosea]
MRPRFLAAGDFEVGEIERKSFPDGERYMRLAADSWGRDVVLLGGTPTDMDTLDVYDLGYAISRAGAHSLALVMPYFGYATMERAVRPGEVVTAKTRAHLISTIPACDGGMRVFLFDLHTDGIEFYFDDSHITHHLYGASLITASVRRLMGDRPFVLGATDAGRAKWVQSLARSLGVEPAFVYKSRDSVTGKLEMTGINADVKGREVVVYDDMIRTGSSLLQAGRAYLAAGATAVHAIASHLVLPPGSLDKLRSAGVFQNILGTDSHPGSQQLDDVPNAVTSVAEMMVKAIERS